MEIAAVVTFIILAVSAIWYTGRRVADSETDAEAAKAEAAAAEERARALEVERQRAAVERINKDINEAREVLEHPGTDDALDWLRNSFKRNQDPN